MSVSGSLKMNASSNAAPRKSNQNIQVYLRVRPTNERERLIRSHEMVEVPSAREVIVKQAFESKSSKKFTFDRAFGPDSKQSEIYHSVVAPLIEEVLSGYNCTVFAYGQTGTGKTHTMVGDEIPTMVSSWEDDSDLGIIPRSLSHLFQELRLMGVEFSMRVSYLELYNEELCDLLSASETAQIRIFDDANKKGSIIVQGLEEIPVHSTADVYKLLAKGQEKRRTASTLMNAQSSRSHTIFSILVHIRENGMDGEELLKIGKLNLVDLAGSENLSKAGNEKGIRTRETVNINQSLLTLGRVITALVERTPHIPYRESKLTRLLQESLGGRTKTSIIATVSPGHKDLEETLSTLEYAHRAKNIQNKPEINQKLTKKTVLKEYTEEIDRLKRDLMASRDKNGIYLAEETYNEMQFQMQSQNKDLNEKVALIRALKEEMTSKQKIFNEISLSLVERTTELQSTKSNLIQTTEELGQTKSVLRTTKRGYHEKKLLLENHIQTEEKLTDQAIALIDVVESASTDTYRLHDTIERRRTVDAKILSASEIHAEAMDKELQGFNTTLAQMLTKYNSQNGVQIEEFEKNAISIRQNCSTTSDQLNSILALKQAASKALAERLDSHADTIQKQLATQQSVVQDKSSKHNETMSRFSKEAVDMLVFINSKLTQQQATHCAHHDQLINLNTSNVTATTKFCELHCNDTRSFLPNVKQYIERNEECNAKLRGEIEANDARLGKMQQIMKTHHELMTQMCGDVQQSNERNANHIGQNSQTLKELLGIIEQNSTQTIEKHEQFAVESNQSHMEQSVKIGEWNKDAIQFNAEHQTTIAEMMNANAQQKALLDAQIAETMTLLEAHHNDTVERIRALQTEIADIDAAATHTNTTETESLLNHIQLSSNRQVECNSVCVSLNNAMARDITAYGQRVNENVLECRERLENFHRNDMQTYRSTGETPAKREFQYSKQLAQTSPHDRIVRRFWNNFDGTVTDLDCSLTICEGNESTFLDGLTDVKSSSILINNMGDAASPTVLASRSALANSQNNIDANGYLCAKSNRRSVSAPNSPILRSSSKSPSVPRKHSTSALNKENVC